VSVKGKGEMETWYLVCSRSAVDDRVAIEAPPVRAG
jgi:hypothetical protein